MFHFSYVSSKCQVFLLPSAVVLFCSVVQHSSMHCVCTCHISTVVCSVLAFSQAFTSVIITPLIIFYTSTNNNKVSDLGHSWTTYAVHRQWVEGLQEEFFKMGDVELAQGLPVSPMCNRNGPGLDFKGQVRIVVLIVSIQVDPSPHITSITARKAFTKSCHENFSDLLTYDMVTLSLTLAAAHLPPTIQ